MCGWSALLQLLQLWLPHIQQLRLLPVCLPRRGSSCDLCQVEELPGMIGGRQHGSYEGLRVFRV